MTPFHLLKPHKIKLGKGSEKNLHKSEIQDECATSKSKPQITLLMVKPNRSEEVNPLCLMTPILSYANGDEFEG